MNVPDELDGAEIIVFMPTIHYAICEYLEDSGYYLFSLDETNSKVTGDWYFDDLKEAIDEAYRVF